MISNEINYVWKNDGKRYEKKLDKTATMMLMGAVVLCYPNNNQIASKLSKVLPTTEKILVDYDRAQENPENSFILCVLENGTEETVKAPLTNPIIWSMFKEWGEGKTK